MKKIVIGICDDQYLVLEQLKRIVSKYIFERRQDAEIILFQNGNRVINNSEILDILFLDIEMPGMDGIEVGKYIRKTNTHCKVIMATSHVDRFKEAFKIEAYRFISKPFEELEIVEALDDAMKTIIGTETLLLYENRIPYEIMQREIQFISAYDGYVEAIIENRKMRKDISLTKLEKILDKCIFYRINRENVLNLLYVDSYKKGIITMGNYKFTVARRKKKDFESFFVKFDITYRGF
ncbi:MAG: LytTR family DNA-binding domain-containing protein [Lachnospiraceae bacterium]